MKARVGQFSPKLMKFFAFKQFNELNQDDMDWFDEQMDILEDLVLYSLEYRFDLAIDLKESSGCDDDSVIDF